MYERRKFIAASAGIITISGCLGGGTDSQQDSQEDGGTSNSRPASVSGVTITGTIFDIRDVNNDGVDDLVIGAYINNENSQEATLSLAYEIQFPDGTTVSDRGQYTALPGESTFEGPIRLTPEVELFTEAQVEYVKSGDYEYEIWIQGVEGVSSTNSDNSGSVSGKCNPSAIQGDPLDTVGWKTEADGIYELETLYLTLVNLVEFPVEVTATIIFYGEGGATDVLGTSFIKNEVLEGGESREFELGGYSADDFSVGLEINCP